MTEKQSSKKYGITQEQVYLLSIYFRCHRLWERLSLHYRTLKLLTDKKILTHIAAFKKDFITDLDSVKDGENIKWTYFDREKLAPVNLEYVSIRCVFNKAGKESESYKLAKRAMTILESLYAVERQFRNQPKIRFWADDFQEQIGTFKTDLLRLSSEAVIAKNIFEKTKGLPEIQLPDTSDIPKEDRALATLTHHPDWTDTKIATSIGVNRTTLYDMKRFKAAREILKQGRQDFPKGMKHNRTVEAFED